MEAHINRFCRAPRVLLCMSGITLTSGLQLCKRVPVTDKATPQRRHSKLHLQGLRFSGLRFGCIERESLGSCDLSPTSPRPRHPELVAPVGPFQLQLLALPDRAKVSLRSIIASLSN